MSHSAEVERSVQRIVLRVRVGSDRMAATDDPVFLGLRGPAGREFRVALGKGHGLRRKGDERYVFAAPSDPEANVAQPELNDPTSPMLDGDRILGAYVHKRQEPIPNVRGFGELDDRLQLEAVEATLELADGSSRVFRRQGPIWLGLACGLSFELEEAGA